MRSEAQHVTAPVQLEAPLCVRYCQASNSEWLPAFKQYRLPVRMGGPRGRSCFGKQLQPNEPLSAFRA